MSDNLCLCPKCGVMTAKPGTLCPSCQADEDDVLMRIEESRLTPPDHADGSEYFRSWLDDDEEAFPDDPRTI